MKLSIIYMASGEGNRFKSNKLLYKIGGKELYKYGLINFFVGLKNLFLEKDYCNHFVKILVVSAYKEILDFSTIFLCNKNIAIQSIKNENPQDGVSNSIKLGINAFEAEKYVFAVADQPCMSSATFFRFMCQLIKTKKGICCCKTEDDIANPIAFSKKYKDKLLALSGNMGGKIIVKNNLFDICYLSVIKEEVMDIDVIDDISKVKQYLGILD